MRYTVWSPLPPDRSGIADYTDELLVPLAALVDVTAVTANPHPDPTATDVPLVDPITGATLPGLPVYHMGNHAGAHAWIYRQALARPGLLVLHDTSLLDFHLDHLGGVGAPAFRDEVAYAHGPIRGRQDDPALYHGWPAIEADGVRSPDARTLTMERRLVDHSRGVLVHDPHSAGLLRARYPRKPIFVAPAGAPIRDDATRTATRARFGWRDEHAVLGVFGGFGRIKRILVAVLAFGQVRRRWPNARLLIAGHVDSPDVLADVRQAVDQQGLASSVHIVAGPPKAEFQDLITATDAVINLRWPTAGETSAVMMRAFGAGRIVITSDLPQNRHHDPAHCWRIPTDPATEATELVAALQRVVRDPAEARTLGRNARDHSTTWPEVARHYRDALRQLAMLPADLITVPARRPGVNLFADLRATSGLAESARRHARALHRTGIDLTYTEFNTRRPDRTVPVPHELADLRGGKDYPIDLWLVNLNEFHLIDDHALDRYTIALWAWELPTIPDGARRQLKRIDELWVVSSFVADAFRTVTDIPIMVVPNVVPDTAAEPDRRRFGLAEDEFVVLFSFSAASSDARKNPWGAIEAFRRAFPTGGARLVIKVTDLPEFPALATALTKAVAEVDGILVSGTLERSEMDTLLAGCDVYLSLHRSEGYGLGMAEAMALGKPVIATGCGGNTDFMPPGAAAMVGFDVRPITEADHHYDRRFADWYRPGELWAEPNVTQAAHWLQRLADDPTLRNALGERGREAIRAWSGDVTVGNKMRDRLAEIDWRLT